ncbi:choice-of-anchor I family protein [Telluria beijingensis]|uniref:choice-of-anchor I family protein n=1 Tax=Telluria beijingensis TaxID=3068633 RepID=UPI002795CA00|nr:choice-of-anchor I family protein [Massilia sp. REN29]
MFLRRPASATKSAKFLPMMSAIALACMLAACGGDDDDDPTPTTLALQKIGSYNGGAVGAAEITAYDAASRRLFVVNGANGTVDVLDLAAPATPKLIGTINVASLGKAVNSVAVHDGLVALAIESNPKTEPGTVAFYNAADLKLVNSVKVGALPDMLTFTPDGSKVLVANEGEPSGYGVAGTADPEGSVSVITVNRGGTPSVATADFRAFNGQEAALRAQGIRIFGPNASAAQDFEPEYITVGDDGRTAYVTLQENNAIAIVDVATAKVTAVKPLGFKDHNVAGMGMDASDEDGGTNTNSGSPAIRIGPQPVKGMYLPDAIASFTVDGKRYLITANEGDARADWPGFNEESRVRAHCTAGLDPAVFPDAANKIFDSNLGRLRVTTTPNGGFTGKNAAGQCTELYTFGGRSFSIWDTDIKRVYDSGDEFERRTTALPNVKFNASNDNNDLEDRSASKGPEPEGAVVGKFGDKHYAFIGLERVGGVMVYDVSKPAQASFVTYLNTRDGDKGDLGPEGLTLIPANRSPNGKPLLIVGNEVSGTTAVMQINLSY